MNSKLVKLGRNYIPLGHILRFEIDVDLRVKVYLREMIGPYPRWIASPPFNSLEEAENWINKSYSTDEK